MATAGIVIVCLKVGKVCSEVAELQNLKHYLKLELIFSIRKKEEKIK